MDPKSWVARKLSAAISDLSHKITSVLQDNDVSFELEFADFSCESAILSNMNINKIFKKLETVKGMCDFFAVNASAFSKALYKEISKDLATVANEVSLVVQELELLSVVRTKIVSGVSQVFNEMFAQIKFISRTLLTVASGNFKAVVLLDNEPATEGLKPQAFSLI